MSDKAKGKAKEAWGALTGDESMKDEGRAQQRKGDAQNEAAQRERTSQAKKDARQAERDRNREKVKDEGLLGGVSDSLSGRDRNRK
ncbi:MAG: CsbD family protein [Rubrobacter sp.]|nr:CsbD family protein [Rubrobacter sp.]